MQNLEHARLHRYWGAFYNWTAQEVYRNAYGVHFVAEHKPWMWNPAKVEKTYGARRTPNTEPLFQIYATWFDLEKRVCPSERTVSPPPRPGHSQAPPATKANTLAEGKADEIHAGNDLKIEGVQDNLVAANQYNNLGLEYNAKGEYVKAIEFIEKALAIDLNVHGDQHPDTAIDYNNLGLVYNAQGRYMKAVRFFKKALKIFDKVLGHDHPNTKAVARNLARVKESAIDSS